MSKSQNVFKMPFNLLGPNSKVDAFLSFVLTLNRFKIIVSLEYPQFIHTVNSKVLTGIYNRVLTGACVFVYLILVVSLIKQRLSMTHRYKDEAAIKKHFNWFPADNTHLY
uniref:Ion_trans domain-containing protein n=1 Tax=Steinernema glaseri TaxID=37863 RepID=A0A1I8AJJ9_9BILA